MFKHGLFFLMTNISSIQFSVALLLNGKVVGKVADGFHTVVVL